MQSNDQPWQLKMFHRSLKKQQKLKALLDLLGNTNGKKCLLVTNGDNNGALNWYFRENGGEWTWADVSGENNDQIAELLGEPVHDYQEADFGIPDGQFDCVVSIDVLEHLKEDQPFLKELKRVLKSNGTAVVTVPNGDPKLLANRIKWKLGMTPEVYGHTRAGYTVAELSDSISKAGLHPKNSGGYSRFVTEILELAINFGYVRVLAKKRGGAQPGHIAPVSSGELKTHGMAYKIYSFLFPIMWAVSLLDNLFPARTNNAVIVTAQKQDIA
ncbi:MAG TPA: class I SAM-dependent methyltransferase [Anaerolineales bacterium]|nr:class I SAM-dependent methyltransferase [Anaerolineales bacterium]